MVKISEYDDKLMQMIKRRNLSDKSIQRYNLVFTELFGLFDKLPSQLLDEFREEQQIFINKEGNPRIKPIEDRKINKYQFIYDDYLKDKYNSDRTKEGKLRIFRAFCHDYNLELPKPIIYNTTPIKIRTKDLPTWDNVNKSLKHCNSMEKALVTFIATSRIRSGDVREFTIQDLLEATSLYHKGEIEELLNRNPLNVVPFWDFMPKKTNKRGNLRITFNSGECSYYLFEYLKERDNLGYSLTPDTPLFHTFKNPDFLSNNAIPRIFQRLNSELHLGKDKNRKYIKFRAHNLRKLFSTTCRRNMSKTAINMDNYTELDIISVFMGHTPPNAKNS
ncbi:MAG: hypothetical protein FWH29_02485 [Methanobrevibacter sp.]|nr:hypothetical protein [Methanobrevibacter sp.]